MSHISDNLIEIRELMAAAAARSGRKPGDTTLLVVSKTFPPEAIREAAEHTEPIFAESRVQEALEKIPMLPAHYRWHFIGHLQSNKVRKILPLVGTIHSIDSLTIAQDIDRIGGEIGVRPQGYVQVNVASDAAKFGFSPATVRRDLEAVLRLQHLDIIGLMTIPPAVKEPEESRSHFAALRKLRDALETEFQARLPGLSMGMSDDFPIAIEEGATIVRVGSRIFGKR
jgi:pyridoxal phosphate enzyme (YggS family)